MEWGGAGQRAAVRSQPQPETWKGSLRPALGTGDSTGGRSGGVREVGGLAENLYKELFSPPDIFLPPQQKAGSLLSREAAQLRGLRPTQGMK